MSETHYLHWSQAGGPNECEHGYAEGIPCPDCDKNPKLIALHNQWTFVKRVLEIFGEADQHEQLFWRVTDGQLLLLATCNDTFYWATADVEQITPENLPILEQTLVDLQKLEAVAPTVPDGRAAAKTDFPLLYLSELFAARSRKMRPQRPCYEKMSPEIAALFDACGPERDRKDEG